MTLTDAGPLVALIDKGQKQHEACVAALDTLTLPLLTTWPAWTEAMYLLGRIAGWPGQNALWQFVLQEKLLVAPPSPQQLQRIYQLMEQYRDTPMDLADASLVALAEDKKLRRIFTLDRHFQVYRLLGKRRFEIVPA